MKKIFVLIILVVGIFSCKNQKENHPVKSLSKKGSAYLPKAIFITTGLNFISEEDVDLPQSVIIALQTFNKRGIPVRLEPRDVLYDSDFLAQYDIIILSTANGCHDVDRQHSLTYMTDSELLNLRNFVQNGGVIIAGDNVGRNHFDGTDRVLETQRLDAENYPLSEVFGVTLVEKNEIGFMIKGKLNHVFEDILMPEKQSDFWTLVPDKIISKNLKVLAEWKNDTFATPAITQNNFGSGMAFLLSSSDFIDTDGETIGRSMVQIQHFYNYVIDEYNNKNQLNISLNPWPNGHNTAFCMTFNPNGELEDYQNILQKCNAIDIQPTFFVSGLLKDSIRHFLMEQNALLASNGYAYQNYEGLNYPVVIDDILHNENIWTKQFSGFRFPFTSPELTGFLALHLHDYAYESSISVNNLEFMHGSVFPYNIVLATQKFFKSTDLLEISPTYHDDYFFLNKLLENEYTSPNQLQKDVLLYEHYLQDFWEHAVKPYNGLMVFMGHPGIVGANDTTIIALEKLVETVKSDNAWLSTIDEIAAYRTKLNKFRISIDSNDNQNVVYVQSPDQIQINNLTIVSIKKPKSVKVENGKARILSDDGVYKIVFDAFDGQVLKIFY